MSPASPDGANVVLDTRPGEGGRAGPSRDDRVSGGGVPRWIAGFRTGRSAADLVFAGTVALTAWWFVAVSRDDSFVYDDWAVAARPASLSGLLEPHNNHLSIVPLAIYQALGVFGLETFTPYRLLGVVGLLCLVIVLHLFARRRVGGPMALVVGVAVLWVPTTSLTPFLVNFHLALICAVVCAAVMPTADRRSDLVLGSALLVALASSSVGVAVTAACGVHAVSRGFRPTRWVAVGLPGLLWLWWWRVMGDPAGQAESRSALATIGEVVRGVAESFGALTGGWLPGALVLGTAWTALLVRRAMTDRASAATQLAWAAGLLVWWGGLVLSRGDAASSPNTGRYAFVGGVLLVLSVMPTRPEERLRSPDAPWPWAALAVVAAAAIVVANHDDIARTTRYRAGNAAWAEMVLYEVEHVRGAIAPERRLGPQLAGLTVAEYRTVVARHGRPFDPDRPTDEALIELGAVHRVITGPPPDEDPPCAAGPVLLAVGAEVSLHTGEEPATVYARRFGSTMRAVQTVPAHRSAVVRAAGPTIVAVPWVVEVPDACLHG